VTVPAPERAREAGALLPVVTDAPGVRRIVVPTPWVRDVNVYVLEGEPLTLVDTGPGIASSSAALERTLASLGHAVEDVELVVLTHQHFDHMGIAGEIAARSGAAVASFGPAAAFLGDYAARVEAQDDWLHALMVRHGVPPGTARAARAFAALEANLGAPVDVTMPLAHGDTIEAGGRMLRVLHRPGHSPSDIVLHDETAGLAFTGDHLLGSISSNALLALPLDRVALDTPRTSPLVDYRRSLYETVALDLQLVLGGHGPPATDPSPLVADRIRRQDRRAGKLLGLLRAGGPRTAFDLAEGIWGSEASGQVFLVLSEVLGHLDLLVVGRLAVERDLGGPAVFAEP